MLDAAHDVIDPVHAPSANWWADWRGGVSGDYPVVEVSCGDLGWGMDLALTEGGGYAN